MRSGTSVPGSIAGITLTFENDGGPHLQPVRLHLAVADHVVAHHAERVLGAHVDLALEIFIVFGSFRRGTGRAGACPCTAR